MDINSIPSNEEIHDFAVDTVNQLDSPTGKIIHIAAFETGAKWMRNRWLNNVTMQWNDIREKRPDIATEVLCLCSKGSLWTGFRVNGGWQINTTRGQLFISNYEKDKPIDVAYWLDVPKLPKELFYKLFPENEFYKML